MREEAIAREKPVYLATLFKRKGTKIDYEFYALNKQGLSELAKAEFPHGNPNLELVAMHHLPKNYAEVIRQELKEKCLRRLGGLLYRVRKKTATSEFYFPKTPGKLDLAEPESWSNKIEGLKGLGAYLDLIAIHHLETQGVKKISTTESPSPKRIMQLQKAGLTRLTSEEVVELKEVKSSDDLTALYKKLRKKKLPVKAPIRDWKLGLGEIVKKGTKKSA